MIYVNIITHHYGFVRGDQTVAIMCASVGGICDFFNSAKGINFSSLYLKNTWNCLCVTLYHYSFIYELLVDQLSNE